MDPSKPTMTHTNKAAQDTPGHTDQHGHEGLKARRRRRNMAPAKIIALAGAIPITT